MVGSPGANRTLPGHEVIMSKALQHLPTALRLLLGLIFFVFGLNGFLNFIPMPPPPEAAGAYLGALAATGYFFPVLKGTELVAGLMLLGNRFVPLALILLAPIVVHIALYHVVLAPGGYGMVGFMIVAELLLAYAYRANFAGVLAAKSDPAPIAEVAEVQTKQA